jgi:hypothetical protein
LGYRRARDGRARSGSIYSRAKQFLRCAGGAHPIMLRKPLFMIMKLVWHDGC